MKLVLISLTLLVSATNCLAEGWSYRVVGVSSNDVLNVRSGPAADYPVLGIIPPHAKGIGKRQCIGTWCNVAYVSPDVYVVQGWVQSRFLAPDHFSPRPHYPE